MVNQEELELLKTGVDAWNKWREANNGLRPDLRGVNLSSNNLSGADLRGANLRQANLNWIDLRGANLRGANLSGATLNWANLSRTDLSCANLVRADLRGANLSGANISGANLNRTDLSGANLWCAQLSGSNMENANLSGCSIYGVSAWNLKLEGANQSNLIITPANEMTIAVDDLEVGQFIGLLLQNHKLHNVIDTITSKIVLIVGQFHAQERQDFLNAIRSTLRNHDYLPVFFDFGKPSGRDLTQKISRVATMARFIIADLTDLKTMPPELHKIVPYLESVPVQPIVHSSAHMEYAWCEHFQAFPWVLKTYCYDSYYQAIASIEDKIVAPPEAKANALVG